jgi:hypothetical protein
LTREVRNFCIPRRYGGLKVFSGISGTLVEDCCLACMPELFWCKPFSVSILQLDRDMKDFEYSYTFSCLICTMSFSDVIHLFSKIFLAIFFNHLFQSISVALVPSLVSSFNASYAASSAASFPYIPVCAGTHINFKLSLFSASMFKILFSIEFFQGKNFLMLLGYSIAFKNISALKIVVCGNNRYISVEESITTAQPALDLPSTIRLCRCVHDH